MVGKKEEEKGLEASTFSAFLPFFVVVIFWLPTSHRGY